VFWIASMTKALTSVAAMQLVERGALALDAPLIFEPGTRWEYGINTDWVGQAIEAVSGQTLDGYFRAHIFAPLGMSDTAFLLTPEQRARLATVHQRQADGSLTPTDFGLPRAPEIFGGGGGLHSSARDYLTFTRMLLGGGRLGEAGLLHPEMVAQMARNQIGDLTVGVMRSDVPERSNDADFFPGMTKKWGLGFLINTADAPSGRRAGSLTWGGLGNTYFWIDPTRGVSGVILTQILPFVDPAALQLYAGIERALYDALDPT
jgi:CubicO group peptidase (beta-lactamase class C family)